MTTRSVRQPFRSLLAACLTGIVLLALALPLAEAVAPGNQGLQGGWAIDDSGNVGFAHSVSSQLPIMQDAGAGWVRINFRLGNCFADWTTIGCNGKTALQTYDPLVNDTRSRGFNVLGLISNESWPGNQSAWIASNTEVATGTGDNAYIQSFAQNAAGVLAAHFDSRIGAWQVWNEPNAWTSTDDSGNPTGGTFIYPSNFAWMLKRSHSAIKSGSAGATVVSGGLFGHDQGGNTVTSAANGGAVNVLKRGTLVGAAAKNGNKPTPPPPATCSSSISSGADYLCATYARGIENAGWTSGSYPLDEIGQHIYVDIGGRTSASKITRYLKDVRDAYAFYEGATTSKRTSVTEIGWTTAFVSERVQSQNLRTAYETIRSTSYVTRGYWFFIQDIPAAQLFFGLVDPNGNQKSAYSAYQTYAR
jgi:hypothetical protein